MMNGFLVILVNDIVTPIHITMVICHVLLLIFDWILIPPQHVVTNRFVRPLVMATNWKCYSLNLISLIILLQAYQCNFTSV